MRKIHASATTKIHSARQETFPDLAFNACLFTKLHPSNYRDKENPLIVSKTLLP